MSGKRSKEMARIEATLVAAYAAKGFSRSVVRLKARPARHGLVRVLGRVGAQPLDGLLPRRLYRDLAALRRMMKE